MVLICVTILKRLRASITTFREATLLLACAWLVLGRPERAAGCVAGTAVVVRGTGTCSVDVVLTKPFVREWFPLPQAGCELSAYDQV